MRNREDLAWAAGIYEGEGSLYVCRRTMLMSVKMTDLDVLQRLRDVMGFGVVYGPYTLLNFPQRKPTYAWQVGNFEGMQAACAFFWPWLGMRRRAKIVEVLTTIATRPRRRYGVRAEQKGDAK